LNEIYAKGLLDKGAVPLLQQI